MQIRPDALRRAVTEGRSGDVPAILARGERDVNAVDLMGQTELHLAATLGAVEMVRVLLAHGADPNRRGGGGLTALDAAEDQEDVVAALRGDGTRAPGLGSAELTTPEASHWLLHRARSGFGVAEPVAPPAVVLGRDSQQCDIVLDDAGVASVHARIEFRSDGCPILVDLGSKEGSGINGIGVIQAPYAVGDRLTLGGCELEVARSLPWRPGDRPASPSYQTVASGLGPGVTLQEKLGWIEDLGERLAAAHAGGLVHGGLGTHRIRLAAAGQVQVDLSPKRPGELGSSPEQLRGEAPTARSDVFAATWIAFHILTGRPPFTGDTLHALMYAILNEHPPNLVELGLSPRLGSWLRHGLAKDPIHRYADGAGMLAAFRMESRPGTSHRPPPR